MSLGAVAVHVCRLRGPDLSIEVDAALAAQQRAPRQIPGATAIAAALATGADWVWVVDGATVPRPDALAAFEAAHESLSTLPPPLLLAGKILDEGGSLHPDAAPRHEIFEKPLTVAAVERGLVQLRAAPAGSLLVHRRAFERFDGPRTDLPASWAWFDFTARILRSWDDTGFLVPSSVAVRRLPPRLAGRRGGGLRTRARLLAGPAWTPTERLWEGFLVAEAAVRAARAPARRA